MIDDEDTRDGGWIGHRREMGGGAARAGPAGSSAGQGPESDRRDRVIETPCRAGVISGGSVRSPEGNEPSHDRARGKQATRRDAGYLPALPRRENVEILHLAPTEIP